MTAAIVGFIALFALLFLGIPIAFGMGIVGVVGFAYVVGWEPAFAMVSQITMDTVFNYNFSVLPLFALMGSVFAHSRMADELYDTSYAFIGHRRGGLAMATILACGAFSAVSGSSLACAATMSRVCVPMMRRYGYEPGFAAGTVAVGSTLDILIPPSLSMVVYSLLTNVDLGKLMIAGFLPGALMIVCYLLSIAVAASIWPHLGPKGQRTPWPQRIRSLRDVWPLLALFTVAIGGIYTGVFTPTEAAGIGSCGAFFVVVFRRRLRLRPFVALLNETARTTSMVFIVVVGALLFANFLTVSGAATAMQAWVGSFHLSQVELILALLAIYLVLGCLLDASAMMLLTVPIFLPIVLAAGIDPLWYGIFMILVIGIGMIHPPLGMLLFVVRALVPDLRIGQVFAGVLPYLAGEAICVALLIAFPGIVLVLPSFMK
jgi:tripartite ATP-independent transporter DctM subunit